MQALKRILRYLHGTISYGLRYSKQNGIHLHGFSDSNWGGDAIDRCSTTGYSIFHGSNLISWISKKQRIVSRSSTEAEYRAVANTTSELAWIESLLREIGFSLAATPTLWCDNLSTTYLTSNPIFHSRTKHLELDFHFVRERVAAKSLIVRYISTEDQVADVFTKPLSRHRFQVLRDKLAVFPKPPNLRGVIGSH